MTDDRNRFSTGEVDATGQPLDEEQVLAPQQVPMDDAAGGPDVDNDDADEPSPDDLSTNGA